MGRTLKKLLLTIVAIVIVVGAGLIWFCTRTPSSPFDGESADTTVSADLIEKGRYVARVGDCVACHSIPGKAPFSGGLKMGTPVGAIYTTNITPDPKTGIGDYSLADFDRAVRQGVAKDGHRLYPAMPFPSYSKLTDDDVKALYAYFMNAVKPAEQPNKESEIPWPLNMRWPLALWSLAFTELGVYQADYSKDEQWNRGAYLVQGLGHCGACHTPRGLAMNEKALDEDSKEFLAGAPLDGWYAPSLRGDHNLGLKRWSEQQIVDFLKKGRNEHAVIYGSKVDIYNNSLQYLHDDDAQAIAHYLKSLPGNPERDGQPWKYEADDEALSLSNRTQEPGAQLYVERCAACHGQDGKGQGPWISPLAGAASMLSSVDDSAINITLNGSGRLVTEGMPDAYRMPPFRGQLSDRQIADVLSFVRTHWGNHGGKVDKKDVADLRHRTDPASSDVIILQMR